MFEEKSTEELRKELEHKEAEANHWRWCMDGGAQREIERIKERIQKDQERLAQLEAYRDRAPEALEKVDTTREKMEEELDRRRSRGGKKSSVRDVSELQLDTLRSRVLHRLEESEFPRYCQAVRRGEEHQWLVDWLRSRDE